MVYAPFLCITETAVKAAGKIALFSALKRSQEATDKGKALDGRQ